MSTHKKDIFICIIECINPLWKGLLGHSREIEQLKLAINELEVQIEITNTYIDDLYSDRSQLKNTFKQ